MEKQYIVSERAHFMCPNMHFGILVEMRVKYDYEKVFSTLDLLAEAHPFLRSLIAYEEDKKRLYYDIGSKSKIDIYEMKTAATLWSDYDDIGNKEWNVFENGLLKVFLYSEEDSFKVLFAAHHLLGDGRSVLGLACEFADAYEKGIKPIYAEERLIQGIEDLPCGSDLTGITRWLIKIINYRWRRENKRVSYEEYVRFANQFVRENQVGHESASLSKIDVDYLRKRCKENKVSVNDLLMAKLYLAETIKKIIIAVDIRDKLSCYRKGAMGNYSSAIGIACTEKSGDVFKKAGEVHKQVKLNLDSNRKKMLILSCYLNMDLSLIDAAAIAALGDFNSKAARFIGGTMLGYADRNGTSITNLGSIESETMESAMFIPPASPATVQTIGVLTVNGTMQLCSSYYKDLIMKEEVNRCLQMMIT